MHYAHFKANYNSSNNNNNNKLVASAKSFQETGFFHTRQSTSVATPFSGFFFLVLLYSVHSTYSQVKLYLSNSYLPHVLLLFLLLSGLIFIASSQICREEMCMK